MASDSKLANAVGGKTARACDNCVKKRARWYCAADDAFLCQGCDASVHSANPLARRHERVRLKTASSVKPLDVTRVAYNTGLAPKEEDHVPTWHQGFTRKARTPRHKRQPSRNNNPIHDLVPDEACSEEENEEQLLYRVPVLDPFVNEFCTSTTSNEGVEMSRPESRTPDNVENEWKEALLFDCNHDMNQEEMHGSLPSEMDLEQFAADVESLLGKGLDDESFDMEGLGFMDCKEENLMERVKVEEFNEEGVVGVGIGQFNNEHLDFEIDVSREGFEFNFDDGSLVTCEEDAGRKVEIVVKSSGDEDNYNDSKEDVVKKEERSSRMLRLDYESVITCWAQEKSPWTNGQRPQFHSFSCFPYCMGNCGKVHEYEDIGMMGHAPIMADGGREARVSRYREKRRTRLFSKKIRYEVRKLNAEKRPRMKGRFVKRENLAPASSAFP